MPLGTEENKSPTVTTPGDPDILTSAINSIATFFRETTADLAGGGTVIPPVADVPTNVLDAVADLPGAVIDAGAAVSRSAAETVGTAAKTAVPWILVLLGAVAVVLLLKNQRPVVITAATT